MLYKKSKKGFPIFSAGINENKFVFMKADMICNKIIIQDINKKRFIVLKSNFINKINETGNIKLTKA